MPILPQAQFADPSQYAMAWDAVFEALAMIIVFAFAIERALAQIFETPLFLRIEERFSKGRKKKYVISKTSPLSEFNNRYSGTDETSLKPIIASVLGILVAYLFKVDLMAVTAGWATTSIFGCIMTGLLIAGGSKASIKLFQDVLNAKSSAYDRYKKGKSFSTKRPTPDILIAEAIS